MKKFRKTTLAGVALMATMSLALTACGSGGSKESAEKELKPGEVAEFTWLHRLPDKEGAKTVNQLVEEFNKSHPDIKVKPETMQGSAAESYAKINSIVEAGKDVPCLTQIGFERVPDMLNAMQDVSKYTKEYQKDYLPAFFDKAKVGEQSFGLPQGASPMVMYYRADLFDQYGIKPPTNWEEYKAAAKTIREKSGKKAYISGFLTDEIMWWSGLTSAHGAQWFGFDPKAEEWAVSIDSKEAQETAKMWQELVDEDLVKPISRWGQEYNKFISDGTFLTNLGGAWEAPLIADSSPDTKGKWKVAQMPQFDGDKFVGQNGGTIAAVLKGCKYPKQAVEFAHWFTTNVEGLQGLGLMPTTKVDKLDTPKLLKDYFSDQNIYDEFVTANNKAPKLVWAPQIAETFRVMGDTQAKVGSGKTLMDELKAGDKQARDSLAAVGVKVKK